MTAAARLAPDQRERLVHVIQGDFAIAAQSGVVLTTVLGSCVATCLWDPHRGIGGMNHFLLPGDSESDDDSLKYGVNAMELLVNALLQQGALRTRLQAKLFGGANVIRNLSDIGAKNAAFATEFLKAEGIPCIAQSMGGDRGRRIRFWPTTGRAGQALLESSHEDLVRAERVRQAPRPPTAAAAGSVELF